MSNNENVDSWDEITIKYPGWRPTPEQVMDFLRAVFPEDAILAFQQRIAEGAMRGAVKEFRDAAVRKFAEPSVVNTAAAEITALVLSHFDPDHQEWGGKFPSRLLCPHHDTATRPAYSGMTPVASECPGYPRCRAGMEIRATRR